MKIVVIGTGGLGRETMEVVKKTRTDILGFIDDNKEKWGQVVNGFRVLGGVEYFKNHDVQAVCGIGDNYTRRKVAETSEGYGARFTTAVHPNADIGDTVRMGRGTVITSGNTVG